MKYQNPFLCSAKRRVYKYCLCVLIFLSALFHGKAYAQDDAAYEEIIITLNSRIVGNAEIPAIIYNNNAYLPIKDFFDFLKIKNEFSSGNDSISGFLLNSLDSYSINRIANTILYKDSLVKLQANDLFYLNNEFYLKANYFGSIFKMDCKFNFRSLSVNFDTKIELPSIRLQKQEEMRKNIANLKGETKADTIIQREFSLFKLGVLDWDLAASQSKGINNAMVKLGFGGMLAGGEMQVYLNYNQRQEFKMAYQNFFWRYVNNEWKTVKQIIAGRVQPANAFSLYKPLLGLQLSNSPTTHKKAFGKYLVSNTTEPGWIVELYVNDVLIDYTRADATGLFSFEVPLVYGNSNIKYRYYGPWGEEKFSEQQLTIPFTFLPQKKFEYNLTAGKLQDETNAMFSRLQLNYGLSNKITIGAGSEYNTIAEGKTNMPFVNASARLGNNAILFGEYVPGVLSKANINYRLKSSIQVDVDFAKYQPGQQIIFTNARQTTKLSVSAPIRHKFFNGFGRLLINNSVLPKGKINNTEFLIGGSYRKLSANFSVLRITNNTASTFIKGSFNIQLPKGIRLSPQLQYQTEQKRIAVWKVDAEKRIFRSCVVNLGYENNKLIGVKGFSLGIRQIFSFAQTTITARQLNSKQITFTQNANGGILFNKELRNAEARAQKHVGRGGLLIVPFLDYNNNGKKEKTEPMVKGLLVNVKGAQVVNNFNEPIIKISGMEAYAKYYLTIDDKNFENPAWQIKNKVYSLMAQPNIFRRIEVPVLIAGEVNGYVYLQSSRGKEGLARVRVHIYNDRDEFVTKILTEADGYFSYLGLSAGKYYAVADPAQLEKIKMKSEGKKASFVIEQSTEGDIVDNVEIFLKDNDE